MTACREGDFKRAQQLVVDVKEVVTALPFCTFTFRPLTVLYLFCVISMEGLPCGVQLTMAIW